MEDETVVMPEEVISVSEVQDIDVGTLGPRSSTTIEETVTHRRVIKSEDTPVQKGKRSSVKDKKVLEEEDMAIRRKVEEKKCKELAWRNRLSGSGVKWDSCDADGFPVFANAESLATHFFRVYTTPKELYDACVRYFRMAKEAKMRTEVRDDHGHRMKDIEIPEPITVEGLCKSLHLSIEDFAGVYGREVGYEGFHRVVEWAKNYISDFLIREGLCKRYDRQLLWSLLKQHSSYFDKAAERIVPLGLKGDAGRLGFGGGEIALDGEGKGGKGNDERVFQVNLIPASNGLVPVPSESCDDEVPE